MITQAQRSDSFAGQVAVVTGGGSGIGRAVALALSGRGARVWALDIDEPGAEETARLAAETGNDVQAYPCDVTQQDTVSGAFDHIVSNAGKIDVLVNCAGLGGGSSLADVTPEYVASILAVNLNGVIWACQAAARHMAPGRSGHIVSISSEAGTRGAAGSPVYAAAKGAVISLTKSLAKALAGDNITVNCVCPGPTDTPMFQGFQQRAPDRAQAYIDEIPMKRLASPADIAAAVVFLCSDAASYITGAILGVDGGLSMAP